MKRLLLILFTTIAFSQSKQEIKEATEKRDKYLFAVQADPKKFNGTVNFDFVLDELFIPVTINGKTYNFLFDTGAVTIVAPELIAELGLRAVTTNHVIDAAGITTKEEIFMLDNLTISGVSFSKIGCASMTLESFSKAFCRKVDGIFGSNIMRLGNWKIDYNKHTIDFSADRIKPGFDYNTVEFENNFSGTPLVSLVVGDVRFPALIDTGNNRYLDLPDTIYKLSKLPKTTLSRKSHGRASYALSGNANQDELAVLTDSLYFGDVLLKKQRFRVSPSPQVLIGNKFLKQFGQVVISWDKSKIYVPKHTVPIEKEYGFGFTPFVENNKMVVVEIWEGSEAENKGMAINDIILKVDDLDVSVMSYDLWCEFLNDRNNPESVTVEIQKPDGSTRSIHLDRSELLDSQNNR